MNKLHNSANMGAALEAILGLPSVTNYPVLQVPTNALSSFPVRYTYPSSEQNLNTANWKAAAAVGGDLVTTKLFWDKF